MRKQTPIKLCLLSHRLFPMFDIKPFCLQHHNLYLEVQEKFRIVSGTSMIYKKLPFEIITGSNCCMLNPIKLNHSKLTNTVFELSWTVTRMESLLLRVHSRQAGATPWLYKQNVEESPRDLPLSMLTWVIDNSSAFPMYVLHPLLSTELSARNIFAPERRYHTAPELIYHD